MHKSASSQVIFEKLEEPCFTLIGFDEEEVAQGVSIISTMFQRYISLSPNSWSREIQLPLRPIAIDKMNEQPTTDPTTPKPLKEQRLTPTPEQKEDVHQISKGKSFSTHVPTYPLSSSMEMTPEPDTKLAGPL